MAAVVIAAVVGQPNHSTATPHSAAGPCAQAMRGHDVERRDPELADLSVDRVDETAMLDQHGVRYTNVTDSVVRAGRLRERFDVLIVPDITLRDAREGMTERQVPARYGDVVPFAAGQTLPWRVSAVE